MSAPSASILAIVTGSILRPPPTPTLFPYTTLFRSQPLRVASREPEPYCVAPHAHSRLSALGATSFSHPSSAEDRKSTRLNSSHGYISYAVFCSKKKKKISTFLEGLNIPSGLYTYKD